MRFRYLLPAVLLTAGSAMAQAGAATPNAIGVWNSNAFGFVAWYVGLPFAPGTPGTNMWQALPPEVTTYFRSGPAGARELDFRGVELTVSYGFFQTHATYDGPRVQIQKAKPNPAQLKRWIPDNAGLPYVDVASTPGLINGTLGAGNILRIYLNMAAVAIPTAPAGVGNAIMFVWQDFDMTYGDGNDLFFVGSSTEPAAGGDQAISYSGGSTPAGQNFILPNGFFGPTSSSEYCVTWCFEQSMIQPVKNGKLVSSTGFIIGGASPPAPFTVDHIDGRGAIHPNPGEWISYSGNSTYGNPQPNGGLTNTWFAPFTLFSGDVPVASPFDPTPETWDTGGNNYIYKQSVQDWIDDFCAITAACGAGTGALINPSNSNYGLWLGIDLPAFINVTVLLNGIAFADISSIQWAGPVSMMYDNNVNASGLLGRNLASIAGYFDGSATPLIGIREHRTLLAGPQSGYTPVTVFNMPNQLGFGINPGGLGGHTFSVQCWMLDLNITQVVDVTNVATARLQ